MSAGVTVDEGADDSLPLGLSWSNQCEHTSVPVGGNPGKDPPPLTFNIKGGEYLSFRPPRGSVTMTFGEKIRSLRRDKKLSQRDLAGRVGLNFTYLSKIENGKLDFAGYPSEGTIVKVAEALGADQDELLLMRGRSRSRSGSG
jgi:DNA-binding XRE family transcriptional regulator